MNDEQKVKELDPERAISIRATRSFRQAKNKWAKINREYPATLDDHIALERLKADFRGIVTAFFIDGALIIGFNPQIFHFNYCGGLILPHAFQYLQNRYWIILTPIKGGPLTIRDGEKLLEAKLKSDRDSEEFRGEIENFRTNCLTKVDQIIEPGQEE
jgi:hypothetical protein